MLVRKLARKRWALATATAAALTLTSCGFFSTDPDTEEDSNSGDDGALEAPMLAEQVEAGDLPPLEERLPEEPLVVEPVDDVGQYGGEWRTYALGPDDSNAFNPIGYDGLVRWAREYTGATGVDEIIPNLADFEVNDDGSSYTFHLKEGVKWSDGEAFDADDIMFWYEGVILNKTLTPETPVWLQADGELVEVVKVDDYTVRFDFAAPTAFFLHNLAHRNGVDVVEYPEHYMSQFHPDYGDDVQSLVDDSGFGDWSELFLDRAEWRTNTDIPRLSPWVVTDPPNEGTRAVAERNPYYWKTDPDGKQLPYFDEVTYAIVEDPEVALLRALDGEVDLEHRALNQGDNYSTLVEGKEAGGYDLMQYNYDSMNIAIVELNLTHKDEVKREIFNNKDFRIGLSHAINREEIIDLVYNGQGEPWQMSPLQDSPFYNEQLAKQYAEYDVELANQHLDEAGYTERNNDGIRLGPDGEPIVINLDVRNDSFNWTDVAELLTDYWREVGIELRPNPATNELITDKRDSNEHDAVFGSGLGGRAALIVPYNYVPIAEANGFGVEWARWYQGYEDAEEPPQRIKDMFATWRQVESTFDSAEQEQLFQQIIDQATEEFFAIGIATPRTEFAVVSNAMRNLPPEMPSGNPYPNPDAYNPEHFFKDE